jgi:predicted SAM-dependent methyltransferase
MKNIKKITPLFIKTNIMKLYLYIIFIFDFKKFVKISKTKNRFPIYWKDRNPQLFDRTSNTDFDTHYIYHPAWASRIIAKINPKKHTDISSILSFSTMLSAFIPVEFYDYRPANVKLDNLTSKKADLTSLPFEDNSIESLSCMHTIEHIGLGRYGDLIDPDGDIKAMNELSRVLAINGNLLFVTPVGKSKIQFNAHRIYSYDQIISYFPKLTLKEFSLIPDNALEKGIIKNATKELSDKQNYACGCFWFIKK